MTMPFYVAPEQVMKDRADYARKGIARGRSLIALVYDSGVVVVAENPSSTLRKVSEIYDRIAFAGVGRYNEYDQLRRAGVRSADLTGYSYSREDVNAKSLATSYAQYLGQVFTHEMKPMEVEILVAEVGADDSTDELYHILFDGTVMDEDNFSVLGGDPDEIVERLEESWKPNLSLVDAIKAAASALSGPDRTLGADELEVAALERNARQRAFRRIEGDELAKIVPPSKRPVTHAGEPKADLPPTTGDTPAKADDDTAKKPRATKKSTE
jgi:proteasome alpha subunit